MKSRICLMLTTALTLTTVLGVSASDNTATVKADVTEKVESAYIDILSSYANGDYNEYTIPTYCITDIDKNGIPELIVETGTCEADYQYHFYSYENGKANEVYSTPGIHSSLYEYPYGNGILLWLQSQGAGSILLITMNNGKFDETTLDNWNIYGEPKFDMSNYSPLQYDANYNSYAVNDLTELYRYFSEHSAYVLKSVENNQTTVRQAFDDITAEVLQIQSFISKGLYLEAIRDCKQTKNWHNLSQEDISLLDSLQSKAYNSYEWYLKTKPQQYRISDWAMNYKFEKDNYPETYGGYLYADSVSIYSKGNDSIHIYSSYVGDYGYCTDIPVYNAHQYISAIGKYSKENFHDCEGRITTMEILSENQTTVGGLPAWQVTFRGSTFLDRYGSSRDYFIERCTAFQYGNWLYAIVASKDDYTWGEDFWNKMEMLRTSIYFN